MTKKKVTVQQLTHNEYLSLHDAEQETGLNKKQILDVLKVSGITVSLLFGRYTVLDKHQLAAIKRHVEMVQS